MSIALGLVLSFLSALAVNWAYSREHDAANELPPLTARHPFASARKLLGSRAWLLGFGAETAGWIVYVAALHLAPLALVQTVGAAGIAVLALFETRGRIRRLPRREQAGVVAAVVGLGCVSLALLGHAQVDHVPNPIAAVVWLGVCAGAAFVARLVRFRIAQAAALGAAAGLLFAIGDVSAKLLVFGGGWFVVVVPLLAAYGLGSVQLQAAFQHGDALTAAGVATLATNAVPIAAGIVLLRQSLPGGPLRIVEFVAFGLLVVSGALLTRRGSQRSTGRASSDSTSASASSTASSSSR